MTFRFRSSSKDCLGQHPALVALHGQGEQPYGQFSIEGHREAAELDGEPKTVGITAPLLDEGQIRSGEGIAADGFALIFRAGNKGGLLEGGQIVASGHGDASQIPLRCRDPDLSNLRPDRARLPSCSFFALWKDTSAIADQRLHLFAHQHGAST